MKKFIKKFTPEFVVLFYHWLWAFGSALFYAFPSRGMVVIGVTGTKGKSSTVFMLARVLEEAGLPVAVSSSLVFKIKEKEWVNPYHMTMVGRHRLQSFISQAKKAGCKYLIMEVTSEGIKQHRSKFIDFDMAIFTNLTPEHLQAHGGSFENYKHTKGKLFESLSHSKKKTIDRKKIEKIILVNGDDEYSDYFLNFKADKKYIFGESEKTKKKDGVDEKFILSELSSDSEKLEFLLNDNKIILPLFGKFNAFNAGLAAACANIFGVSFEDVAKALKKVKKIEGRAEYIKAGQKFDVIVDLAHTPSSYEAIFEAVKLSKKPEGKVISVFGAAGGGRDKWKRPELGRIAAENSDIIILTNEDPYDEDPKNILENIKKGIDESGFSGQLEIIEDRKEAIKKAVEVAGEKDILLFLGKGTERTQVIAGKAYPWNEEEEVKKVLVSALVRK
jgi:UDP-N-acetylmuramoyl-L-alanyl-D-glutamate--2,6-diaminopimelate ligase